MISSIQELTLELIKIDTRPENTENLDLTLQKIHAELSDFPYKTFQKNGVKSVLFYNFFPEDNRFHILFNSHLDIIPAKKEQFVPKIQQGKIYGAGALDMKGGLSAALFAFKNHVKSVNIPVGFQFVTDEEVGGYNGTKHQIESGICSDFVITTEPTNLDIVHKAKGVFQCEIHIPGKTAHSAYPWRGENAILRMNHFLTDFQKNFQNPQNDLWETTYNLSEIQSPLQGYNKIPDICSIKIDIRYTHENITDIEHTIRSLIEPYNGNIKIYSQEPIFYTDPENPNITNLQNISSKILHKIPKTYGAHGTSDGRHFQKNAIEFGPIGGNIGGDEEWVDIQSLENYYLILSEFLQKK